MDMLTRFDPNGEQLRDSPYETYEHFRNIEPVHWGLPGVPGTEGAWYCFGYADCERLLDDARLGKEVFHRMPAERLARLPETYRRYVEKVKNAMIVRDPPEHTRLRGLVNKAFTKDVVQQWQARVEEVTDELLDGLAGRGRVDLIADFAVPLPVYVIGQMIGVPREARAELKRWSVAITRSLAGSFADMQVYEDAVAAIDEFGAYILELAARRRVEPRDDIITKLVQAESEHGKLAPEEVVSMCRTLLVGGHETTTNLVGNGAWLLSHQHPDQGALLREDHSLWATAVVEILRFESPVQYTFRIAYEDLQIGPHKVLAGQRVITMLGSANRDEGMFDRPREFKVRGSGGRPVHFGRGPHHCIGSNLGAMEGRIALSRLFQRFPLLQIDAARSAWRDNLQFRGLEVMPAALNGTRSKEVPSDTTQ